MKTDDESKISFYYVKDVGVHCGERTYKNEKTEPQKFIIQCC